MGEAITLATAAGLLSPDGPTVLLEQPIRALASGGGGVFAVTDEGALLERGADGDWSERGRVPGALCAAVLEDGGLLVGTDEPAVHRLVGERVERVEGFDSAPGRDDWDTPWGGAASVRSIAVGKGGWFVNVHVGGVLISRDEGRSWEASIPQERDVHQVVVDGAGDVWLANGIGGLGVSRDGGRSFQEITSGLHVSYARAVALTTEHVLLSVSSGPSGRGATLYRAPRRHPGRLTPCAGGLPPELGHNVDTHCLATAGARVAAVAGGTLYESPDSGNDWSVRATDLPSVRAVAYMPRA